jgi:hypothetical protein
MKMALRALTSLNVSSAKAEAHQPISVQCNSLARLNPRREGQVQDKHISYFVGKSKCSPSSSKDLWWYQNSSDILRFPKPLVETDIAFTISVRESAPGVPQSDCVCKLVVASKVMAIRLTSKPGALEAKIMHNLKSFNKFLKSSW